MTGQANITQNNGEMKLNLRYKQELQIYAVTFPAWEYDKLTKALPTIFPGFSF